MEHDEREQLEARVRQAEDHAAQARGHGERLEIELDDTRVRFEAVVRQLPVGVVVAEAPSGQLVLANERVEQIWGRSLMPGATIGQYFEGFQGFHPDGRPYALHEWPMARAMDRGEVVQSEEIAFVRGDGTRGIVQVSAAPIRDREDRLAAGVVVFHDVTAHRRREEELARVRSDFISTISHDLRTPLTAARAGLGLLETSARHQLDAGQSRLLGSARRSIQRLGLLIDDLVTVNQLDTGTLHLDREPLDLRSAVTAAMPVMLPLVQEKEQALEVDCPSPLPVEGDAWRLEQAIVNLLANAHHHTPAGTRIVIAGRVDGGEVRLTVRDNGPGIPAGEHERIFERYVRGATAASGSGLGLTITRSIVELHGGRIWLESARGRGTAFHVSLPYYAGGIP